MKFSIASTIVLFSVLGAQAQILETHTFSPALTIPDNDVNGVADNRTITSAIQSLSDVNVQVTLSGGFNGDLYLHLSHESGLSVLLNRVGKTSGVPLGYPDSGFQITLDDAASNGDIHLYRAVSNPGGGPLTGAWSPDGRASDPLSVLDTDARSRLLNSFNGKQGSGVWTLYAADLSPLSQSSIQSWTLELAGVPEPEEWALMTCTGLLMLGWLRRAVGIRRP